MTASEGSGAPVGEPGRRERKKQQLRERIVEAASALVAERGLSATTVEQISAAVDVSQTTFFNYFPTKQALVSEMVDRMLGFLDDLLATQLESPVPTADKIRAVFGFSLRLDARRRALLRELGADLVRSAGAGTAGFRRMQEGLQAILHRGQRSGDVRDDREADLLAEMVVGIYTAVVTNWTADSSYPIRTRFTEAGELAAELVAPRPTRRGRKTSESS